MKNGEVNTDCCNHVVDKCGTANKEPIFKVEYLICYVCCEMLKLTKLACMYKHMQA